MFVERLARVSASGHALFRTSRSDYRSGGVEHGADRRSLSGASQSRSRVSRHERSLHAFYPTAVSLDRSEVARSRFYLCYRLSATHLVALPRYPEGCLPRQFPQTLGRAGDNTLLPLNRSNWPQRKAEGADADRREDPTLTKLAEALNAIPYSP